MATGNGLAMGSMVVWAAGFPAADILLDTWNPLPLAAARVFLAVALLVPIWVLIEGPARVVRARWGRGTFVGGLGFGLGAYLIVSAQWFTDPVTVAIIAAASPLCGGLVELVFEGRRLGRGFWIGLAFALVGGVVATGGVMVGGFGIGAALALGSCFLFAWGSWATVKDFPDLTPLGRTTITLGGGLVFTGTLFLVAWGLGWVAAPQNVLTPGTIGPLLVYAIGGMALSQFLWIGAVARLGVAVASFHINVAPFYVMLILVTLGEAWSWPQAIGAAIVALGVVLAQH